MSSDKHVAQGRFLPDHGGDRLALARFGGLKPEAVLDFSVNTRPDGPPEFLRLAMTRAMDETWAYPSPDAAEAREACARLYGLHPGQIVFGNGTAELLHAMARMLSKAGCPLALIPEPAFGDYERACALADLPTAHPPCVLTARHGLHGAHNIFDWHLPEEALLAAPKDAAVILANPGNPAGTWAAPTSLARLMLKRPDLLWIIDEAFAAYVGRDSLVSLLPKLRNELRAVRCIIVRSLTKFHALAGVRCGYLAATGDLASRIQKELPPWSVNCFSAACALALFEQRPAVLRDERETRARNRQNRRTLLNLLSDLPLTPCRSAASYVLLRLDEPEPDLARELLTAHGIALRDCANYRGLEDGRWYRVAVRGAEDSARLARALTHVLGKKTLREQRPAPHPGKRTPALMLQGTCSGAGKSVLAAAFCRIFRQDGYSVAPFKAQNMSLNSGVTMDGLEMGRAQIVQAQAAGLVPDCRMNPVLLKPLTDKGSQVVLLGRPHSTLDARAFLQARKALRGPIAEAYASLSAEHDIMVLEGAGSPAEVNLKEADLVNMNMASLARARVLLCGDIDRGGVYASFIGSWLTFSLEERKLLAGYVVNHFRGDQSLLAPAHDYVLRATGKPVLAVVPWLKDLCLPEEDSVTLTRALQKPASLPDPLDVLMVVLGRTSNFTDLAPLAGEPDVCLRLAHDAADFGTPDVVILPGSRSVAADMASLRAKGLDEKIRAHALGGGWTVGLCGGMQMMGACVLDPLHVESGEEHMEGLNLLPLRTTLGRDKVLTRLEHVRTPFGPEAHGYEIHHGYTELTAGPDEAGPMACFKRSDDDSAGLLGLLRGHCLATYLHGLFDADEFRRAFLDTVRASLGKKPQGRVLANWNPDIALDRLADRVRACFDMQHIYRLLGL